MSDLLELLKSKRILICGGSGGVGKTTTAAALGVLWATLGRKVMVITIDPARRLADALGLPAIGTTPGVVDPAVLRAVGQEPKGQLSAMMLEAKSAWDELIRRYAPNQEVADKILANKFYQSLSDAFAGSHEYLALEKLYELDQSGKYDAIVVDTPPTKHALDFLEAPSRMNDFLDRKVVRILVMPYLAAGRKGLKLFNKTASYIFKKLEDATGISVLRDISEFFFHFSELTDGSRERMHKVFELLKGPKTGFLLVTSPEPATLSEARYFVEKVHGYGVPFAGVIANRVHELEHSGLDEAKVMQSLQEAGCSPELQRALKSSYFRASNLAIGHASELDQFSKSLPKSAFLTRVPLFPGGLQDLAGLSKIANVLGHSK